MPSNDFEVMPIGTRVELATLRNFVEMLGRAQDLNEVKRLEEELRLWYQGHNDRHMI